MPNIRNPKNPILSEYVKLLGWSTFLLMILTVLAGVVASVRYGANAAVIEGISHRDLSQGWTIALLWVPLIIQLLVLMCLSVRVWKDKADQTMRHYFKFYFIRTFVSTFAYVTLWLIYTFVMQNPADRGVMQSLRWVSLILIGLLVLFVVQATYLITRSSFRSTNRLFTSRDIEDKYVCICDWLRLTSESARQGNQPKSGTPEAGLRKIHEWLLKDRDYKVHRVAYKGTMADLDIAQLVEALNRLVCSRQFYNDRISSADGNDLPPSIFESNNRDFINENLLKDCANTSGTANGHLGDSKDAIWRRIWPWDGDTRSDKQMGQRDGIALFPFYTMVFFFSLFLCLAYLFGLAFAFEDRSVQSDPKKPSLGLLMSDDLLEDLGQYSAPRPSPTPFVYQLSDRQKFFYFNRGEAGVTTETNANDKGLKRIAEINAGSLKSLVDLIKNGLQNGGLRVLMVGRADEPPVNKVTYSSNYEIATARISSVRYLLQEKLIEEQVSPRDLATVEWVASPFSNDGSLKPKEKQEGEHSKSALVLNNTDAAATEASPEVPSDFYETVQKEYWYHSEKPWHEAYRTLMGRLEHEVKDKPVTLEMRQIHDDIATWAADMVDNKVQEAEKLRDVIDAKLYLVEDANGRQRVVEVYLYDTKPEKKETGNTSNLRPNAKRMALIDYLYFAITTGNNDVKPITPFSKFLCTFANLTQFFFIVVFFNTLLSLKKKREAG